MMGSERSDDDNAQREGADRAAAPAAGHLALLDALLDVAGDAPAFPALFVAARGVFAFEHAMVLREEGDGLHCVAADPEPTGDGRWPACPALAQAVRGRVLCLAA